MLKTMLRGLAAASLAVLPLTVPAPAPAAETLPSWLSGSRCIGVVDGDGLVGDGRCCVGDDDLPDVAQPGVVQVDVEH
ncbi:hypothetical protein RM812_41325, partial [Streptomyces sp. DSM 40712]|nr:hypothetical protein [Streptomyces sp. DSM 40712]